jgi:hypothetical protein
VKAAFEGRVKAVVVPPTPGAAVVKGAVIYGLNPKVVAARVARRTYGVGVASPFQEGVHDPKHKFYNQARGKHYATDVFSVFVHTGDMVKCDDVFTDTIHPSSASTSDVTLKFYSCPQRNPVHLDEAMVREEGTLHTIIPGEGLDRQLRIKMKFGRTQIVASAINDAGLSVETKLAFAQDAVGLATGLVAA